MLEWIKLLPRCATTNQWFFSSSSAYNYDEGRTSEQYLDAPFQADNVVMRASNGSWDDGSAKGSKDGSCNVDLNRFPVILGEERTQFERVVEYETFILK